jgi:hypothetical protein
MARIFINYRRSISRHTAHLLSVYLRRYYNKNQVFFDQGSLVAGDVFPEKLTKALGLCEVFLAVIDKDWHKAENAKGPRLSQEDDWVRREVQTVLERNQAGGGGRPPVLIVPLLFDDARMPDRSELPEALRDFCDANAVQCRSDEKGLEAVMKELQTRIDDHLGSPPMGDFGFEVLSRSANLRKRPQYRFRAAAHPEDLNPYVELSDNEAEITDANPELWGPTRFQRYNNWAEWTARDDSLDWHDLGNEVRSFLSLEHLAPDGTWETVGVSIILPLKPSGGCKLMGTGAPPDDYARKVNALALDWYDFERHGSPCLLLDSWIIRKLKQAEKNNRPARFVHESWGTWLVLRHLAELWEGLPSDAARTFLVEPDNPVIHRMLWNLGFERHNRNAASGDIYYFQYPPNPYLYDEKVFRPRIDDVMENIERSRAIPILREHARAVTPNHLGSPMDLSC